MVLFIKSKKINKKETNEIIDPFPSFKFCDSHHVFSVSESFAHVWNTLIIEHIEDTIKNRIENLN